MILTFNKPKKKRSTAEHNDLNGSDCGVAGTYTPNMSEQDMLAWKAKLVGSKSGKFRVEIRTMSGGCNALFKVNGTENWTGERHDSHGLYSWKDPEEEPGNTKLSVNAGLNMSLAFMSALNAALSEARQVLQLCDAGHYKKVAAVIKAGDHPLTDEELVKLLGSA